MSLGPSSAPQLHLYSRRLITLPTAGHADKLVYIQETIYYHGHKGPFRIKLDILPLPSPLALGEMKPRMTVTCYV